MLNLVPWYYRAAAIVALVGAVFAFGYVKGLAHQKELDDEKFAEIRTAQDEQAIHAGRIALDRSVAVGSIVDTYEAQRRDLDAYYGRRLRDAQAANRAGAVPPGTLPEDANWRPAYTALAQAYSGLGKDYIGLESECAVTTLMFVKLRDAARAFEDIR